MFHQYLHQLIRSITRSSRRPLRQGQKRRRLRHSWRPWLEGLEDRLAPASYTWDDNANTLHISLEDNESLSITEAAGIAAFTLVGGTFTQDGGDEVPGANGTPILVLGVEELEGALTINNSLAGAGSTNDVTFAIGSLTSGIIEASITADDTTGTLAFTAFNLAATESLSLLAHGRISIGPGSSLSNSGSGDLVLQANVAGTTSGNFTGIDVDGATITTSGTGNILLTGRGGDTGAQNIGIRLQNAAMVQSTASGPDAGTITITGTGGDGTANNFGVQIQDIGTRVTSVNGDIQITGQGGSGTGNNNFGVWLFGAVVSSTGTGIDAAAITITGTGGNGVTDNHGVRIQSLGRVTSADGDIEITGQGGNGTGNNNTGVLIFFDGAVTSTGIGLDAATITIAGTAGAGVSENHGVRIQNLGRVTSVEGDIEITGQSSNGEGNNNIGVAINSDATITSTGIGANAGKITISGTGSDGAFSNFGIEIRDLGTRITSADGDIQITGQGGNGTNNFNYGVWLHSGAVVSSTGTGASAATITIHGTGGNGDLDNFGVRFDSFGTQVTSVDGDIQIIGRGGNGTGNNFGVWLVVGAELSSTGTGTDAATITIDGTGGTGASTNQGVQIQSFARVTSVDGDIRITGQGGNGTGNNNSGVLIFFAGAVTSTGTGANAAAITITGSGGTGTSGNAGVYMENAQVTSVDGAIEITGSGGGGTEDENIGVRLSNAEVSSSGTAAITITGSGGSGSNSILGVWLLDSTNITSVTGNIEIIGTGGSGTGFDNSGVWLIDTTVSSTGSGDSAAAITITGTGGSSLEFSNGIYMENAIVTSEDGNIEITGTGTDSTDGGNVGIWLTSSVISSTGTGSAATITITGTGGGTGGNFNAGVFAEVSTQITSVAGSITITGSGGAGMNRNHGVRLRGLGTLVTSVDGNVTITGSGGGSNITNHGVIVDEAVVSATGTASITITGSGGNGTNFNHGVMLDEVDTRVTSVDGDITITGSAGTGANSFGFVIHEAAIDVTGSGNVTITADSMDIDTGSSIDVGDNVVTLAPLTADTDIDLGGEGSAGVLGLTEAERNRITAGTINIGNADTGNVTITAVSRHDGDANFNVVAGGVIFFNFNTHWMTEDGNLSFSASVFEMDEASSITVDGTANVTINADNIILDANITFDAIDGNRNTVVTLAPRTAGTAIDLGGPDGVGVLGLTDAELDTITRGTLIIGSSTAGSISITDAITRPRSSDMELHSGGAIVFNPGTLDTNGGDLLLAPGAGGVQPITAGTDITAGTVSFASDLSIAIEGTTVDTEYTQLNIDGTVDLDGVHLVLSGAFVPEIGDVFTIVSAASVDGLFNGLNDGDTLTFNDVTLMIQYTATTVTLTADAFVTEVFVDGSGNLVIEDASSIGKHDTLIISLNGTNVRIHDPNHELTAGNGATQIDANTIEVPLASITGQIIVNTLGGNDTLTIDFSGGNPIPAGGLEFDGGAGNDELNLVNGAFHTSTFTYVNASSGSIDLDRDGDGATISTITYVGLEPITSSIQSDVVELIFTGGDETITVTDADSGQTTVNSTLGEITTFDNPTVRLEISATNGTDTINVDSLASGYASLVITADDVTDVVNFNGPLTFAAGHGLTVSDVGTVHVNSSIAVTGSGAVSIEALKNIVLDNGSSITTINGDITLLANVAGTSTGNFSGIHLDGASIQTTGSGSISLTGHGGDSGDFNVGIRLISSTIESTAAGATAGTVSLTGFGGTSPGEDDNGIQLDGSTIASVDGAIVLTGTGGGGGAAGGSHNRGVMLANSSVVSSAGTTADPATITIIGTGGAADGNNIGVRLEDSGTQVSSAGGAIVLQGQGGNGASSDNHGVSIVNGAAVIATNAATVTITGTGGAASGTNNQGVEVGDFGSSVTTEAGLLQITGTAGTNTLVGIVVRDNSSLSSVSGDITLTSVSPIRVTSNAEITTIDGDITLEANLAGTTTGRFSGIELVGATIESTGTGNISLTGRGGTSSSFNVGVRLISSTIESTAAGATAGTVSLTGFGGTSSGADGNGIRLDNSTIASVDGAIVLTGTGGGGGAAGASHNRGVMLASGSVVRSTGTTADAATITITGTGGDANSNNMGIRLEDSGTEVSSAGGAIVLQGQGGNGASSDNHGVSIVFGAAVVATNTATVSITGTGGNGTTDNHGFEVSDAGSTVTTGTGLLQITGTAGADGIGILVRNDGSLSSTSAEIHLIADSMTIDSAVDAGTNTVTLIPESPGTAINLGGADPPGVLGLTNDELNRIIAGTLIIGDSNSGSITLSDDITRAASTDMELHSGGAIVFEAALDTGGGDLLLAPGTGGVQPLTAGTDITAGTVSFASDLSIVIDGTTVDTEYTQLNIDGTVDLDGVNLVLSGTFVPDIGDAFIIVSPTSVTGQFNGLDQGDTLTFNGRVLTINYTTTEVTLTTTALAEHVILDNIHGLYVDARGFFQNALGGNEKWLRGEVNLFGNVWYFVLPDGRFFEWNGIPGSLSGNELANFGTTAAHLKPELIFEASTVTLTGAEATLAQNLDEMFGLYVDHQGFYQNAFGGNEKWLRGVPNQFENPWYFILPTGEFFEWSGVAGMLTGFSHGILGAAAHLNAELVFEAANFILDQNQVDLAFALDQQHGFYVEDTVRRGLWENAFGGGERWLRGEANSFGNVWYFVLPDGRFFEWSGIAGSLSGNELADFDAAFHLSPELIHRAFSL